MESMNATANIGLQATAECCWMTPISPIHLRASKLAIGNALAIQPDQSDFDKKQDYVAYSSVAIISVVAALEANINEQFEMFSKENPHSFKSSNVLNIFNFLKEKNIWKCDLSLFSKYEFLSILIDDNREIISKNDKDNIEKIISVRNHLVHYKANFLSLSGGIPAPAEKIEGMKSLLNFYKNLNLESPFWTNNDVEFPHLIINANFAQWCFNIIDNFIKKYRQRISDIKKLQIEISIANAQSKRNRILN